MTNTERERGGGAGRGGVGGGGGVIQFTHTEPKGNPGGESRFCPSCNTDGVVL
jgi:hypothetical protein